MAYEKGTLNGHPIIQDSEDPGVPITDYGDDTGDIVASNSAWIANNYIHLSALGGLTATDGVFVVGNGTTFVAESGATARTSLGLGTLATVSPTGTASDSTYLRGDGAWVEISASGDLLAANNLDDLDDASVARTNLGLGDLAVMDAVAIVNLTATGTPSASTYLRGDGAWTTIPGGGDMLASNSLSDVASVVTARENLGLEIGVDIQAYSTHLAALASLSKADGIFVVGNGTTFVAESGSTARTSLGLGTLATQNTVSDDNWSGTDLAVANGGTGSSTASGARTNLGLVIGTDIPAYRRVGTITVTSAGGVKTYHEPSDNTAAACGTALLAAAAALEAGGTIDCDPRASYDLSTPLSVSTDNANVRFNRARVKQLAAQDYVIALNAASGTEQLVSGLELDVNGVSVTVTTERGEGIRLSGDGRITLEDSYIYNCPVGDAASCVRTHGTGKKTLRRLRVDNPGWACLHIRSYECDVIDCQLDVSAAKVGATKQRWIDMDAANFGHVRIIGGRWWTDQAINAQAVFDPGSTFNASQVTVEGVDIDCGANCTNSTSGEGVIKPDEVTQFVMRGCRQRHSAANFVYLLWLGSAVDYVSVSDTHGTGIIHAGDGSGINIEECYVNRSSFGRGCTNAVKHAMTNMRAYRFLDIQNSSFWNLIGSGTQAAGLRGVFENYSTSTTQRIRVKNCFFDTYFSEVGYVFRHVREIGHIGISGTRIANRGASGTVLAPTPAQRLMATCSYEDPFTAKLQWREVNRESSTAFVTLGTTTWDHHHPAPTDTTPWGQLTGPPGSAILNMNYGPDGNGLVQMYVLDSLGDYVDASS